MVFVVKYSLYIFTGILDKTKINNIGENKFIGIKNGDPCSLIPLQPLPCSYDNENISTLRNKQNNAKPALQNMYKIIINSCNFCIYWFQQVSDLKYTLFSNSSCQSSSLLDCLIYDFYDVELILRAIDFFK